MAEIPEDYKGLIEVLEKMKIKPKVDNPDDFKNWIEELAKAQMDLKPPVKTETPPATTTTYHQQPRLNNFSGSMEKKSGETTYTLWRYEIQGLMRDKIHQEEAIIQAIRRSLRGDAGLIAMRLGPEASLTQIMNKMESVFGIVDETETIMSEFYNARQKEDEDVSTWSCRLEAILDKAIQSGKIEHNQMDTMLHDMLWKGLRPAIKDASHFEKERHKTFDALRVALRRIEREYQLDHTSKVKVTAKQAISTDQDNELEITGVLKHINTRLERLESGQQYRGKGQHYRGNNRRFQEQPKPQGLQQYSSFNNSYRGNRGRGYSSFNAPNASSSQPSVSNYRPITCRRCGQEGHMERGCMQNTDIHGKALNYKQSLTRGGR